MLIKNISHTIKDGWIDLDLHKDLDSSNTLILVFCSPTYSRMKEVFTELQNALPSSQIVGCSTSGEVHGHEIKDQSLSATILKFEDSHFKLSKINLVDYKDSEEVGLVIGEELKGPNLKEVLILSDGLSTNGSALAHGLSSVLDESTLVTGGLAGDGNNFKDTWIIEGDKVLRGSVVGVGLYGQNLHLSNSSSGGWNIFGPERVITKSSGNVLYEIDNKPALELYKEYLGERAAELPSSGLLFPLQIRKHKTDQNKLVRTLLAVNEEDNSMTFAGDFPEGHLTQLMRANFERIIAAAGETGEKCSDLISNKEYNQEPLFALAISCVGRRLVLGERAEEELESLQDSLPENSTISGFYSYGEIGGNRQHKTPFVELAKVANVFRL